MEKLYNAIPNQMKVGKGIAVIDVREYSAYVFFQESLVSSLTLSYLIHFKFAFYMVLRNYLISFFLHVAVQFSQHQLFKRLSLQRCIALSLLSYFNQPQMHEVIFGFSILFHRSVVLFFSQCHTVLITTTLQYSLKPGRLIPPAPFIYLSQDCFGCSGCFVSSNKF